MTPANSEAGPRHRDRPTAENTTTGIPRQRTTAADVVHVWAQPIPVLGTRGNLRLVLIVERCAWKCGAAHCHNAPADFIAGRRKAACGGGTYVVHALRPAVSA